MKENNILKLKKDIKELSALQRELKHQRKTTNFVGTRTFDPAVAASKARFNRFKLRGMYIVYAKLRGKPIESCEGNAKTCYSTSYVRGLYNKYYVSSVYTSS